MSLPNLLSAFILFVMLFPTACKRNGIPENEIDKINMDISFVRFDSIFSAAQTRDLPSLKKEFPFLFPVRYQDSIWIKKINDTLQQQLYDEIRTNLNDFNQLKSQFYKLFKYTKHYFRDFKAPKIITLISEVDYNTRVLYSDSLMLLPLDVYLGQDHRFYEGIPAYLRKNMKKEQILPETARAIASKYVAPPKGRTFLEQLIYHGKMLYLMHLLLPHVNVEDLMGYEYEELQWAMANEEEIWKYFVEKKLLYSNDSKLRDRFIKTAPFSKFYLHLDNESPGALGRYIGFQVVLAFANDNNVSLYQLLEMPARDLFEQSKYKPRK